MKLNRLIFMVGLFMILSTACTNKKDSLLTSNQPISKTWEPEKAWLQLYGESYKNGTAIFADQKAALDWSKASSFISNKQEYTIIPFYFASTLPYIKNDNKSKSYFSVVLRKKNNTEFDLAISVRTETATKGNSVVNLSVEKFMTTEGKTINTWAYLKSKGYQKTNLTTQKSSSKLDPDCGVIPVVDYQTVCYDAGTQNGVPITECIGVAVTSYISDPSCGAGGGPGGGNDFPPTTGGGGGQYGSGDFDIIIPPGTAKIDPAIELKCFNKNAGAKLTIYVEQAAEGDRNTKMTGERSVGHTFVGIEQGDIIRIIGYYPESQLTTVFGSTVQDGELHDNYSHDYNISISKSITSTQLTSIINYINKYPKRYDLNSYNCSDFGIAVGNLGGMGIPTTTGDFILFGKTIGRGRNPADLGEDIRSMATSTNVTVDATAGYKSASSKSGICN